MKMVGGMAGKAFLSILLFSSTTALQNRETASTVLTHNETSSKVLDLASAVTSPIPLELESTSTDADSSKDVEEDTILVRNENSDHALIQQEGIFEDEIVREHNQYKWPLWLLISLWVVAIPVCSMLGLMLFVSVAFFFNGWWQKRTTKMEKVSDKRDLNKKKMLPEGWAVHLNDEGNIYYVHQASGRSTWEFPQDEGFVPTGSPANIFT